MRHRWLSRLPPRKRAAAAAEMAEDSPDLSIPLVPYVPVRCPRCTATKPRTDGVHELRVGRKRYHECRGCGLRFHSLELDATDPSAFPHHGNG